jgi:uncharacterized membrane protein
VFELTIKISSTLLLNTGALHTVQPVWAKEEMENTRKLVRDILNLFIMVSLIER